MRPFCEPSQACCPDADAIRRDSFKVVLSHSERGGSDKSRAILYSVAPKCRDHAIADLGLPSGQKSTTSARTCPHKSRQATSRCARMCLSSGRCEVAFRRRRWKSASRPLSTRGAPQLTALHLVRSLKRFDVKQPNERLRESTSNPTGALPREEFGANVRSCSPKHGVASSHAQIFMSFPNPPSIMTKRPKRLK